MRFTRLLLSVVCLLAMTLVYQAGAAAAQSAIPTVPPGYQAGVYAAGLEMPTAMAFGPDGRLYVAEIKGNIIAIEGSDETGRSTRQWIFSQGPSVSQFYSPLGLAWRYDDLYVSSHNRIYAIRNAAGAEIGGEPEEIIGELYVRGQHQNNGIAFGPDDKLYITSGSTGNVVEQPHPFNAAILQANPDGTGLRVYASGLRNPYSLAFDREGRLWAPDNGADPPQAEADPDRLNLIQDGKHYGYPNRLLTPGFNHEHPVVLFPVHASANALTFYTHSLMPELQDRALVAFYGPEYNAGTDAAPKLVTVDLWQENGVWTGHWETFATGFDRPLAIAVGPDGRIYVADFGTGTIYWIAPDDWTPGDALPDDDELAEPEVPTDEELSEDPAEEEPAVDQVAPDEAAEDATDEAPWDDAIATPNPADEPVEAPSAEEPAPLEDPEPVDEPVQAEDEPAADAVPGEDAAEEPADDAEVPAEEAVPGEETETVEPLLWLFPVNQR